MALDYASYEEAVRRFDWDDRWELFDGDRDSFNIAHECLDRHDDDTTAARIKFADGTTATHTVGEFRRDSGRFANALKDAGVEKGDRVSVMLDPCRELYVSMFGNWKRGAVHVQMPPVFGPDGIERRLKDSDASLLVTTPKKATEVADSVDVKIVEVGEGFEAFIDGEPTHYEWSTAADDVSVLQYTSGTTGKPEANEMLHKTATYVAVRMKFAYGLRPDDRFFCTSSPSWAHGLWIGTVGPLALGNALGSYSGAFDVETVLEGLEEFGITNFTAAATALRRIVNNETLSEYDLKLERVATAGEKIDRDTQIKLREKLRVSVADVYGVSEFGGFIMNYNGFDEWEVKPGSIGKPFPGFEVAVLDEDDNELPPGEVGEIAVKRGDEWFRSGDLGEVDEDGYYWYKGRADDVIISAGYRIDPHEVEDALLKHEAVLEAAVVGVPDEDRGNVVKGFVKTDRPHTDELKTEIIEMVKSNLSKQKYPRQLEFVNEFPRTKAGNKIKRQNLREREADTSQESA